MSPDFNFDKTPVKANPFFEKILTVVWVKGSLEAYRIISVLALLRPILNASSLNHKRKVLHNGPHVSKSRAFL